HDERQGAIPHRKDAVYARLYPAAGRDGRRVRLWRVRDVQQVPGAGLPAPRAAPSVQVGRRQPL
ncbi:hypothetical protein H4R21_006928, partial [Coemansia helicoidea]